eukprot:TRINITY_DN42953_c0_g1_i1.p1 TRINITY_DN42953_c0_g1~~TRINITY_DN42953_c0_g1_i1.p1  ORF type:complete len:102 (-),score=5.83 TRINITY_DN42953_c0_g1_i1:7-312(-)
MSGVCRASVFEDVSFEAIGCSSCEPSSKVGNFVAFCTTRSLSGFSVWSWRASAPCDRSATHHRFVQGELCKSHDIIARKGSFKEPARKNRLTHQNDNEFGP